jgi:secreted Zn-dependent insulinase-like peptidase
MQVKAVSFPAVSESLMRRYKNAMLKPSHAANALRLQLLSGGPSWSYDQLAEALVGVKGVEEVQAFAADFLSRCHLECLIMGNATAAEARQLCGDVADILNTCTPPAAQVRVGG